MGCDATKGNARKVFHRIASRLPCEPTAGPPCRLRRVLERQPQCFKVPRCTTTPRLRHPFNSFGVFTVGDGVGQQTHPVLRVGWVWKFYSLFMLVLRCWNFQVGWTSRSGFTAPFQRQRGFSEFRVGCLAPSTPTQYRHQRLNES